MDGRWAENVRKMDGHGKHIAPAMEYGRNVDGTLTEHLRDMDGTLLENGLQMDRPRCEN
jgi:hypothetical protein